MKSAYSQITKTSYDVTAEDWSKKYDELNFWAPEMESFARYLPAGNVLEIGTGNGRDAIQLIARGYNYTGIDISEKMLKIAQRVIGQKVPLYQRDLLQLDLPGRPIFDGFWSAATYLHIPKVQLHKALLELTKYLRHEAIGFISLKEGLGEGWDGKKNPRYYAFYQVNEFTSVLRQSRFEVVEILKKSQIDRIYISFIVKLRNC